jgi:hypothetical protein
MKEKRERRESEKRAQPNSTQYLQAELLADPSGSTIVYVPTQNLTEAVHR